MGPPDSCGYHAALLDNLKTQGETELRGIITQRTDVQTPVDRRQTWSNTIPMRFTKCSVSANAFIKYERMFQLHPPNRTESIRIKSENATIVSVLKRIKYLLPVCGSICAVSLTLTNNSSQQRIGVEKMIDWLID